MRVIESFSTLEVTRKPTQHIKKRAAKLVFLRRPPCSYSATFDWGAPWPALLNLGIYSVAL